MPTEFSQRIDPTLIRVVVAIESGTFAIAGAVMVVSNTPAHVIAIAFGALVLPILVLSRSVLRVRLEPDRLVWTFFPMWRGSVRYDDVEVIEVGRVHAMRDFGGWGVKLSRKGFGAVARSGPAVWIHRRSKKRPLVLTTTEASTLAAELQRNCPRAEHRAGA